MSADQVVAQNQTTICTMNVESVNRISKLPVVESTISTASSIYSRVKDFNGLTQWTLGTAESTVSKAVEIGKPYAVPVVTKLDGPIKKLDSLVCSGLDYVETNVPMVKLPAGEILLQMYNNTKEYISVAVTPVTNVVTPAMQSAKVLVEPAVTSAKNKYEEARQMVEPAVQSAKQMVEPYVQPALDKATAIKDYGTNKLEEFLHKEKNPTEAFEDDSSSEDDCADCTESSTSKKR